MAKKATGSRGMIGKRHAQVGRLRKACVLPSVGGIGSFLACRGRRENGLPCARNMARRNGRGVIRAGQYQKNKDMGSAALAPVVSEPISEARARGETIRTAPQGPWLMLVGVRDLLERMMHDSEDESGPVRKQRADPVLPGSALTHSTPRMETFVFYDQGSGAHHQPSNSHAA